ncbi:MAG: hypothetical protein KJO31_11655 [Gammaproteobacteria bacterium]|nr:hypothetical protein [Gammaproteobacteria bacterium]
MPSDEHAAVLLLPELEGGRTVRPAEMRWLCRGTVRRRGDESLDDLDRALGLLGLAAPAEGRAALRYWGQTGARPDGWLALAEPVALEVRLNDLFVHGPASTRLGEEELSYLFAYLSENLAGRGGVSFEIEQDSLYIFAADPMATHQVTADRVGRLSLRSMSGERAAQDSVLTEIEMLLHAASINASREHDGQPAINSLWLSGGGCAPAVVQRNLPLLVADDALFRGFWLSAAAPVQPWPADAADFRPGAGFIAVAPPAAALGPLLAQLRRMQASGDLHSIDLLFRDGVHVEVRPAHRFRFWRKRAYLCGVSKSRH